MGSRRKSRITAMQALYGWEVTREPLPDLLQFAWLDTQDGLEEVLAFSRLLVAGTIEHCETVDEAIRSHLEHWKIERLARVDLAILRMSAYSLLYQRDIPPSVVIDEAVDLAREFGSDDSYRFVNGVLDAIRRDCGQ